MKNKSTTNLKLSKLILVFIFLLLATPAYGATDLAIGTACTDNAECKTNLCEQSTLTSPPNKFCTCSTALHCEEKYTKAAGETWECKVKSPQSQGLAYCQSDKNGVKYPITAASATPPPAESTPAKTVKLKPPKISIPIPNLPEWAEIDVTPGSTANVPYIAQYIIAIYKYALVIGSIMAVVGLMSGGIMYMMGGMNANMINKSKSLIFGSISGIVILISSSLILNLVNPNLTELPTIGVATIESVDLGLLPDYVEGDPAELGTVKPYAEGDVKPWKPKSAATAGYKGITNMTYKPVKDKKCLKDNFFGGSLSIGDNIDKYIKRVSILGSNEFHKRSTPDLPVQATGGNLKKIERARANADKGGTGYRGVIHVGSIDGWKKVTQDLQNSSDPEVKGYVQWMYDVSDGKAPNLLGKFRPELLSTNTGCGAGLKRKQCSTGNPGKMSSPFSDPHVLGLAVDVMSLSNWDIRVKGHGTTRSLNYSSYCKNYKKTVEKMKSGEYGPYFVSDPYHMYDRLEKQIDDCLTSKNAFWSMPDGWIEIFTKNNFYFAGWAWANPKRSDGMHHEFYGNCFKVKGYPIE